MAGCGFGCSPSGGRGRPHLLPPSPLATAELRSWSKMHRGERCRWGLSRCIHPDPAAAVEEEGPSLLAGSLDGAEAALVTLDTKDNSEAASSIRVLRGTPDPTLCCLALSRFDERTCLRVRVGHVRATVRVDQPVCSALPSVGRSPARERKKVKLAQPQREGPRQASRGVLRCCTA